MIKSLKQPNQTTTNTYLYNNDICKKVQHGIGINHNNKYKNQKKIY